ncbi:mediator of RNA polymerase II transcription subunit 23-like [Anneissia japonica]|uniref:mediator of RNA polymerase II transcription subunit 23-like n=1 Tax=Anneissia japonica TaxID=1529436 RepID=UPI0014257BAA|nr:mediator of RNA polymerase II transcription subunit 23-like [Anneissia japonica]
MTMEDTLQSILNDILITTSVEEAFSGFILYSAEEENNKIICCNESFLRFWKDAIPSVEAQKAALQYYIKTLHGQRAPKRVKLLCDLLANAAEKKVIPAKLICEELLLSDKLDYRNTDTWSQTFLVIKKIIVFIDYKGCRDLWKVILDKTLTIPTNINISTFKKLDSLLKVINQILDRNSCLLPSYFAVNEIMKSASEEPNSNHWVIGDVLARFVDSFRQTARMVSITGRSQLLPIVGHSSSIGNAWKLEQSTLRFPLKGMLPYDKELLQPQKGLLRYVLEQPYSRDMICSILDLNKQQKQRCTVLEEQLVDMLILAMEKMENDMATDLLWRHLSSQVIFFVLFQFAGFPQMVEALHQKLSKNPLRRGRDHLMWVLLQIVSGSIKKNPVSDFLNVLNLFDLLYPEREPLPLPDFNNSNCMIQFAVTCIWIHLAQKEPLKRPTPPALKLHLEFVHQIHSSKNLPMHRVAILCNAYSTNNEYFNLPMSVLVDAISGKQQTTPATPLSMNLLDSLTVHAKMSLLHSIVTKIMQMAKHQQAMTHSIPAVLIETYSRLLVYMEIESLGIKGYINQLLSTIKEHYAWGILHTMLEMFSYRLHHVQPQYRIQLLLSLHAFNSMPQTNQNQLYLCIESTALQLITGLGSTEVQPQLSRFLTEPNQLLSKDSEELNRALVLSLARAMHITGSETLSSNWCQDILSNLMSNTPHSWAQHTLECFPTALNQFFQQNPYNSENRSILKRNVDEEYRVWKSMSNEADLIKHFTAENRPPMFLCVLWKMLLQSDQLRPVIIKILENIGPRMISKHIRLFTDYLVFEFSNSVGSQHVNKCIETLNDLVWKLNVVTLDRLILSLALGNHEGNEAQVCFFIIQLLLLKPNEFRNRVSEFVKLSPDHWLDNDWHSHHVSFNQRFPEKFFFEGLYEATRTPMPTPPKYLPTYFVNVCLRFLTVFDIVIHRFLELPPVSKSLETLLDHLGSLYKFHDRPITYLYNTLHYYEKKVKDRPLMKKKLVGSITGSLKDIRPQGWCLTKEFTEYLGRPGDESWVPTQEYYHNLLARLVDTISGDVPEAFKGCDWRFNEFPNAASHAVHVTCIELMALCPQSSTISNALLDVVLKNPSGIPREKLMMWINAVALVITSLPDSYLSVINDRILQTLKSPLLNGMSSPVQGLFAIFDFASAHTSFSEAPCSYVLALTHAVWLHSSIGQLTLLPQFLTKEVHPLVKTEEQLLFVCHLVGPFLQRFHEERTRCLLNITSEFYDMLAAVDKNCAHLQHMDPICDFLYHIKYMFTGDVVKNKAESVIKELRQPLQQRLRFISKGAEQHVQSQST